MKKYSLTDEHRAQLKPWADKWTRTIMSTDPMTDDDRSMAREAVIGLYAAANLPPPKHIVFVPSPFVLRFAGGFAAALWYLYTRDPVAVLTTAPTHRQVKEILWREIRRLHASAKRAGAPFS